MTDRKNKPNRIRQAISFVIVLFLIYLMGRILIRNWRDIPFSELHLNWIWLILSYFCLFLSFILSTIIWIKLLKGLSVDISLFKALRSIALSQVGRYAPGRIWAFVGRTELGKNESIPRTASSLGLILETELQIISSSLVFLIAFAFSYKHWGASFSKSLYLVLCLIPVEILLLNPKITNALVRPLFRLFKKDLPEVNLNYGLLLYLAFLYAISWCIGGFGFFLLAKGVYPIGWNLCLPIAGAYPAAWLVGFLSLITPSGIGIREGALVVLLSPLLSAPMAVALSLLARVWTTTYEGICFLLFLKA